ncbi:SIMPL domain-containing protein [Shigella flexneri]
MDAVPDIATLAIEVNVAAKDTATAKNRQMSTSHNTFPSLNSIKSRKRYELSEFTHQPDYDYQDGKSILKRLRCENGGSRAAPSVQTN